jgi:hypothetical protein
MRMQRQPEHMQNSATESTAEWHVLEQQKRYVEVGASYDRLNATVAQDDGGGNQVC